MNRSLTHLVILSAPLHAGRAQPSATPSAPQRAHASAQAEPVPSADRLWADLMAGNKRFVAGKPRACTVVSLRERLRSGQQPHVIVHSRAIVRQGVQASKVTVIEAEYELASGEVVRPNAPASGRN